MYKCEKHGILESEWCDECGIIVQCDCSDQTSTRVKDLRYDCEEGERTVTIRIYHCATCGEFNYVE